MKRIRTLSIFLILLGFLCPIADVGAQEFQWGGPIPVRDLTPFGLLRLDMTPTAGLPGLEKGWSFDFQIQHANIMAMSINAERYLQERPEKRVPLSSEDAAVLLGYRDDLFYYDGAVDIIRMISHYNFNGNWGVSLVLPFRHYGGGFLDSTIESFHDAFGLGTSRRDLVSRGEYQILMDIAGSQYSMIDGGSYFDIGDPVIQVRRVFDVNSWDFTLVGGVKLPFADEEEYFGSGETDFGLQGSARKKFRRIAFFSGLSNVWVSGNKIFVDAVDKSVATFFLGGEFAVTDRSSVVFQASVSESLMQESANDELVENKFQATGGWRYRRSGLVWEVSFTEDMSNFNNSADFGILLGVNWTPGLPGSLGN